MTYSRQYENLLYQYEILLARLSVREHFLKTVVGEVYENIGQVLSLIRVQLTSLQSGLPADSSESIDQSSQLVGQTIRELRTMCKLFYPEHTVIESQGIAVAIKNEITNQFPAAAVHFPDQSDLLSGLSAERSLLLYSIILQLLQLIHNMKGGTLIRASLLPKKYHAMMVLEYSGAPISRTKAAEPGMNRHLSVYDRVELLGGKLEIKKNNLFNRQIKVELPNSLKKK
jgi:glucose-6-phosphate-specific signal transduction histidine kinase